MKKILLAFDGSHFSEASLDFARKINDKQPVILIGAFLPQVDFANLWSMASIDDPAQSAIPLLEDNTSKQVLHNIRRFEAYCHQNNIRFTTHSEYFNFALPELKLESRFCDLLIVSSEEFYKQAGTGVSNFYLKEILHDLECPLIVIPEKKLFPSANILMYDGSASSVYAIRQFAYLFPEWTNLPTTILHTAQVSGADWPHKEQIQQLVRSHFSQADWELLVVTSKDLLTAWLIEHKNAMVVSGSFGRSEVSMLFRKSFISNAINDHELPVFIAHK